MIVSNNSRTHVEKVKFALNRIVDYHSKTPGLTIKREISRLLKKEAGGVNKKTEQRYEHVIDVPVATPSQDARTSQLIHIKYEVKVEVKISGLYKNLVITAPLIIGNVPHSFISPRPPVLFPALPDLPVGLTVHPPGHLSSQPIGFNTNRLSIISNSNSNDHSSSFTRSGSLSSHSSTSSALQDRSRQSINSNISNFVHSSNDQTNTSSIINSPASTTPGFNIQPSVQPTAPPMEAGHADFPPSYEEVFGSPSTSMGQSSFANSSMMHANPSKT